ncbi:helix-turn-helix domain-containing protein [Proteiniclasticum sp.]|uniref:helix-turn-helix domain-containing protein n=1 Tax=Proteiniclasticum sp. TaxID=2053595 RepID=UPI0028964FC5|nr:helix-turn-helix domain-containing protein [Proteiniclasticum sp.]
MNNEFSLRIKEQRKKHGLTQKEAAQALGIGQTTIANYENGTRVPDLMKVGEIADLYNVSVDYLLGRESYEVKAAEDRKKDEIPDYSYEEYMKSLLDGNKKLVRNILLSFLKKGVPSVTIYREYIERSLKEVGELWEKGTLPIWKEHFISELSLENMALIKRRKYQEIEPERPILLITPGAEQHSIGLKMIGDMLEANGHNVMFLGNLIPTDNIIHAIKDRKPYAILLSVTMPYHIEAAKMLIDVIKQNFGAKAPTILIGGTAFDHVENVATITGADKHCMNIDDIERNLRRI